MVFACMGVEFRSHSGTRIWTALYCWCYECHKSFSVW